ncbi:DUF1722 domain-containing protein [Salipaludibacillus daqingensis]|uniref:DUF1722 domain-containing protein n=1 Tax=Salipaludibacillus daqingensis TaxID=3041001 RepID=UPI0024742EBD|nr:DUF1722 domain-containing protein [Salipaludibacillus daqingensis]
MKREIEQLWAINKYEVMMKGYNYYKEMKVAMKSSHTAADFQYIYSRIFEIKKQLFHHPSVLNTMEHIWGYFKNKASCSEKNTFLSLISQCQHPFTIDEYDFFPKPVQQVIAYLSALLNKYPQPYLIKTSLFRPRNEWNHV